MAVAQEHGSLPRWLLAGEDDGEDILVQLRPRPYAKIKKKEKNKKKAQRPPPHRHRRRRVPAGDSDAAMPDGDADVTGAEPLRASEAAVGPGLIDNTRGHYYLLDIYYY